MNIKTIMRVGIFISMFTSFLFSQTNLTNSKYGKLKGWEKKQHVKQSGESFTIAKEELKNISERINIRVSKNRLSKTRSLQKSSFLKNILEDKNRKKINFSTNSAKKEVGNNWSVNWNKQNSTPTFISNFGDEKSLSKSNLSVSSFENAVSFIERNNEVFKLDNPSEELVLTEETEDKLGKKHLRFNLQYRGLPIWGSEITLHTKANGNLYSLNARYSKTPVGLDVSSEKTSSAEAINIVKEHLSQTTNMGGISNQLKKILKYEGPTTKKYIWLDDEQNKHLVWVVQIRPNIKDHIFYFVDIISGEVLQHYNTTCNDGPLTTSALDLKGISRSINVYDVSGNYYMIDGSRDMWQQGQTDIVNNPKGAILTIDARGNDLTNDTQLFHVTSTNNSWSDPTAVSAHYNGGVTYDYYKNTHGRNAIDDKGSTILSIIHATDGGQPMDNAYWNGALMVYGDGNTAFEPLAGALDVAGHEMTHGVIQHTVALEYKFQSGALNESFADVFGAMVDKSNWLMGEDVTKTSYIASGALRDMENPHNGGSSLSDNGWQPAHMNEFLNLTIDQDNGGVHINSGIPNRACALMGNAIGKDKTEKIYYRIMNARYLNSQSQFIDMRLAAVQAATELYGTTEVSAVKQAFDDVGILNGSGTKPPDDIPAVDGDEWIAAVNAEVDDASLYLIRPTIKNDNDIVLLTSTQIFTGTGNPISITDDGSVIFFIDSENYIRIIASDGTEEQVVSNDAVWNSVSLSPDGSKLAATTLLEDGLIYVFDLENSDNSKAIQLYNPTTQDGVKDSVVKYADALDWNLSSEFLVYDSFNIVPQATGASFEYWTVNILDVMNDKIYSLFPPQEDGISIGNPSFGQTNDNYLLIDKIDFNNATDTILAVNLFSGDVGLIEANGSSIGFPRYSPNDEQVVFQRIDDTDLSNLRQIDMAGNKISSSSESYLYVAGGQLPEWFAIGNRPVSVEDKKNEVVSQFQLHQNYPNPFNPTTTIKYSIPDVETLHAMSVQLKIYDMLGKEVVTLVDSKRQSGNYYVNFNAENLSSGIYYYQLIVNDFIETKKMIVIK